MADERDNETLAQMAVTKPPNRAKSTTNAASTTYDVGYGRPPVATRFQPNRSGNPKGRPKGAPRRKSSLAQVALDRKIPVIEGGKTRRPSVRQVAFEKVSEKALSGDIKSINFLLTRESKEGSTTPDQCPVPLATALQILREHFARDLEKRKSKK